jgi:hypothetical protein
MALPVDDSDCARISAGDYLSIDGWNYEEDYAASTSNTHTSFNSKISKSIVRSLHIS